MKKTGLLLFTIFCLAAIFAKGQDAVRRPAQAADTAVVSPSKISRQNMTEINSTEVPASLKKTLESPQYKGWDKGTFYRAKDNDSYLLEMKDKNNKVTPYRFDKQGRPILEN